MSLNKTQLRVLLDISQGAPAGAISRERNALAGLYHMGLVRQKRPIGSGYELTPDGEKKLREALSKEADQKL